MYIAMFPQLVAGPIVRYADIEEAIAVRRVTLAGLAEDARLFCVGLGKKVLLANTVAIVASSLLVRSASEIGFVGCVSGVLAYTFQIYFDFSGYSDMAIGLGRMIGFDYPRNFRYPYVSQSASEFWRRWHMSLGSFFRDYVYIPLGGSRVGAPRMVFNLAVVWLLTGLWHGAAWNFVLWGLYWGLFVILEKLLLGAVLQRLPRFLCHTYCLILVFFGWLLFAVSGLDQVGEWAMAIFGFYGMTGTSTLWELQSWGYLSLVPVFVIGSLPWAPWLRKEIECWARGGRGVGVDCALLGGKLGFSPCLVCTEGVLPSRRRAVTMVNTLVDVGYLLILALSSMAIVSGSYNPFIYFQF